MRGVNPADNISKFEILPRLTVVDGANNISLITTTLKYDKAIRGKYGINVEFPVFARFDSPLGSNNGVGDINFRFRVQGALAKKITCVGGLETVWPTASADTLGSGKYQVNPVLAVVYAYSAKVFIAPVIKQFFSVAGAPERPDIRLGQYRFLAAYSSSKGYWFLADPQLFVNYNRVYHASQQVDFRPRVRSWQNDWSVDRDMGSGRRAHGWQLDQATMAARRWYSLRHDSGNEAVKPEAQSRPSDRSRIRAAQRKTQGSSAGHPMPGPRCKPTRSLGTARHLAIAHLLFTLPWGAMLLTPALVCAQQEYSHKVLIIYDQSDRLTPISNFDVALRNRMDHGSHTPYFYREFLDNEIPGNDPGENAKFAEAFRSWIAQKYTPDHVDLVVAFGNIPSEPLPGVPTIYVGQPAALGGGSAGAIVPILSGDEAAKTVDLALRLNPGAKKLVLITGTSNQDRGFAQLVRQARIPERVKPEKVSLSLD